jgi:CRP-like cAMP-binding protein
MRTIENAVTLAITADELRTLLADNSDLVRGLFSTLAERVDAAAVSNLQSTGAAHELEQLAAEGLLPIEKILALQRVPVFSRIAVEEMQPLAEIAQTVPMTMGSALFTASAPLALWLILSGEVSVEDGEGRQLTARAGDILGSLGMLSGQPLGRSADVLRSGLALRIDRDDLFDLLGQRPELMRQLFEGMFAAGPEVAGVQS